MGLKKLPKEISYAELYFTLKCNLNCGYCINRYEDLVRQRDEIPARQIADALNKIDFGGLQLTIGGGEPTTRPDFYDLLELIRPETRIDLLTNLQFDVNEFIRSVPPSRFTVGTNIAYKSIRVSYHPSQMEPDVLVKKARKLQDSGFSIGIFGISHPVNIGPNILLAELARKHGVYFFVKEYLGRYNDQLFGHYKYLDAIDSEPRRVECRTSELLIDSSGDMYKCHRDLYHKQNAVGSIMRDDPVEFRFRTCDWYGRCNACDIKSKIDRTLNGSRCNVEIKEIDKR